MDLLVIYTKFYKFKKGRETKILKELFGRIYRNLK